MKYESLQSTTDLYDSVDEPHGGGQRAVVSKLQEGVLVLPLGECVHDVLGEGGGVQALVQAVSISSIRGCSSFNFAFREGFKKCEGQQKYGNCPYFFHKLFPYNTVIIVFKGLKVQK